MDARDAQTDVTPRHDRGDGVVARGIRGKQRLRLHQRRAAQDRKRLVALVVQAVAMRVRIHAQRLGQLFRLVGNGGGATRLRYFLQADNVGVSLAQLGDKGVESVFALLDIPRQHAQRTGRQLTRRCTIRTPLARDAEGYGREREDGPKWPYGSATHPQGPTIARFLAFKPAASSLSALRIFRRSAPPGAPSVRLVLASGPPNRPAADRGSPGCSGPLRLSGRSTARRRNGQSG